ncbi:AraC family transcriptional regulator [Streptomyces rimosus]|uniref:helix-turn-helix domain-containing protein n=1 Tax=Streptomyces rimosus TaxID=1927 RepID=UPI000D1414D7|nr:helix-turn-helix domain-containing protein [Streptomyces rimosus]
MVEDIVCRRPGPGPAPAGAHLRDCSGYRERLPGSLRRREAPSSRVTLVIGFGDPVVALPSRDGRGGGPRASMVIGLHDRLSETRIAGLQHGLLLRLTPLTAYSLLGVPMHLISNETVGLDALLGPEADRFAERLAEVGDWSLRFGMLADALAARMAGGPRPDPAVAWAWRRLAATAGAVRIEALAERLGWSRRHLVRRFREQIGPSPKTVARLFRFERATVLLRGRTPAPPLAAVAAEAGYADQAHFSREVRALAQCTPRTLAAALAGTAPGGTGSSAAARSHSFKPVTFVDTYVPVHDDPGSRNRR